MNRYFLTLAATALYMIGAAYPAPADLSLDVAPAKLEVQAVPGTTQTIPITVRNSGDAPMHIQASVVGFTLTPGGDYVFSKPGAGRYTASGWADLNPREFDIPGNSFQLVRKTVNVPQGITGEYSAIAFFQTRPLRHTGGGITFSERVASKIYLYSGNSVRIDGGIDDIAAKQTDSGERLLVDFRNMGNAHVYLNGDIQIRKGTETVQQIPLEKQVLVERGGRRVIEAFTQKLPPGKYTALALIDFGGPNLAGGQTSFVVK
jgi:hypothetical protein